MDRPTFLTACRRRAIEIALGQPRIGLRLLELSLARDEMAERAAELGIDGAEMHWITGYEAIQPILPHALRIALDETFGGELMDDFTAHQRIRLRAELLRLEQEAA